MAVPYSINYINVKISEIKHVLSETSYALSDLCNSTAVNKWGLHRKYVPDSTAAARLTRLQSTPKQGYFRWYYHSTETPGILTLINPVDKDGGTQGFSYSSLGEYTIERWESSDGGTTWNQIANNTISWFRLILGNANHSVNTDPNSNTVTGASPHSDIHSAFATLDLVVDTNLGDARMGRVVLNHPDLADSDAFMYISDFTQSDSTSPGKISVSPTSISAPQAGGSYSVTVEATASWNSSSIESSASLDWSPKSASAGTHNITVTVGANNTGFSVLKSIDFYTGDNTATLTIMQDG